MTSTAEALSGPWAANVAGWAATTLLASAIVVVQEVATPLPGAGWVVLSVVVQLLASSLWGGAVAGISRRKFGRVVPVASALLWTGIGVTRGLGGALVASAAGLDPEWVYRIGFWTLVALFWMPLLTYALAQWDEHRRMLALRADLAEAHLAARALATESADERTSRLAAAVDDALGPAFDEIRVALRADSTLGETQVIAIAARLDELARQTAVFSASAAVPTVPRAAGKVSVSQASRDFELGRPVLAAVLAAAAGAPLILPEAYRDDGWISVAESAVAIAVSTAVLVGVYGLLRPFRFSGAQRSLLSRVGVVVAGLAGAGALVVLPWEPFQPRDLILLVAVPLVVSIAASATGTAVALGATNVELETQVSTERAALGELTNRIRAAEADDAARLETLIRGDVNGRVASCAFALGLLAHGGVPPESRDRVIAGVLDQLDAAAAELRTS